LPAATPVLICPAAGSRRSRGRHTCAPPRVYLRNVDTHKQVGTDTTIGSDELKGGLYMDSESNNIIGFAL